MIEHLDNLRPYGVGQVALMTNNVWAETTNCSIDQDPDPNSPNPTPVLRVPVLANARYVLGGARDKVGLLARMWLSYLPQNENQEPLPFSWRDGSNNLIAQLLIRPTGQISVINVHPNEYTYLYTTPAPVVAANSYYHIEAWAEFDGGGMHLEVRVEGLEVINEDFPTVTAPTCSQVVFSTTRGSNFENNTPPMYLKDIVVANGNGAHNNTFMGAITVVSCVPNADVDANWTPNVAGPNYAMVDNSPPLDGTQFITAVNPPPAADVYGLTDLPVDVTSVRGIMTIVRARKTDGGDGNLQVSLISDGDTDPGADRPITSAFSYWRDVSEEDPATLAPWLPTAVNAMDISVNRTA